jgi:hypothetical protein
LHTEATESPATTKVRAIKLGKAWVQGGTSNKINENKATRKYNNNKHMNTKMNKIIYENNKTKTNKKPCQVHRRCA